jgi:transcription factor SFP1
MTGTSPFTGAQGQSSSFQSNSYIPKMEANYLRNFMCCDQKLENMHDLLRHYELVHTQDSTQSNQAGSQLGQRLSIRRPSMTTSALLGNGNPDDFRPLTQFGSGQQSRAMNVTSNSGLGFSNMQMGRQQSAMGQKQSQLVNFQMSDDVDGLDGMELDDGLASMELDDSQRTIQQTRQMFGQQQRPQLQLNMNGSGMQQQALRASSQPSTPGGAGFGFQNNPTVSSVNTPTLSTQQVHGGQMGTASNGYEDALSGMGNASDINLDYGMFGDLSGFVNDPAKSLFSPNGTSGQDQRALQQQIAQFGLDPSQFGDLNDPQQLALLQRALSTNGSGFIVPREEDKPFKCPVIGCEKAYKNQNGLK